MMIWMGTRVPASRVAERRRGRAMTAPTRTSAYDQYADQYAAYVTTREEHAPSDDPFGLPPPNRCKQTT